ncbi:MAG: LysR family transcriptional regulator [Hyphomicrobiales bacterium]|nr:LysR family transcriptional regulator [Hyphomicrobiales bacterium]
MERSLAAFLAVARAQNLTAAADRIGLTQPALTKSIRRIELEFNTKLFERSVRGMTLTAAGEMLLARAELIEMHYRQAREEIRLLRAGKLTEFRIAAGTAYHAAVAPDLVKQLSREYPDTHFVLDFEAVGNAMPKLINADIDLLLGAFLSVAEEGIEARPFLTVKITAYVAKESKLAGAVSISPRDLAGRKWVINQRDSLLTSRLKEFCLNHMLPEPEVVMQIDSLLATFRVVAGTEYITLASPYVSDLAEEAGLVMLRLEPPIWRFESGAWYRQSLRSHPLLLRSLELVQELTQKYIGNHS